VSASESFAASAAIAEYYERRAGEYDEWYGGEGRFAARSRPGWPEEVAGLVRLVASLPPARTLDVACGTGFLTRHLRGFTVGVDQSRSMVAIAQARLPEGLAIVGDALDLVVADRSFDRVFTGHFYGHLPPVERRRFLAEAQRVAAELVIVDSALRPGVGPEEHQERVLNDGSRHTVYKRYLTAEELADEIGGEAVLGGRWFVGARVKW
jgi:demethylmenaquinone methyltransferase/2-methoxy-6-polyprenyl-1,4-benzoquinol methylase